jgi:hypothetical protein
MNTMEVDDASSECYRTARTTTLVAPAKRDCDRGGQGGEKSAKEIFGEPGSQLGGNSGTNRSPCQNRTKIHCVMKFYALLVALCLALVVAVVRSEDAIDEKDVGMC